jgi:hypothetical protein
MATPSTYKVLHVWSPADKAWAPLIVAVSRRGHDALPSIRAVLVDAGFATVVGAGYSADDQDVIDRVARSITAPRIAELFDEPGSFTPGCLTVEPQSTGIPVLFVWADLRGSWKPLLVGITPYGRKAVQALAAHVAGAGFPAYVSSVFADHSEAILRLASLIPPPAGAPFVDPPDGGPSPLH